MTQSALITGASSEIGAAIALQLAAQHIDLYLHYFENKIAIRELKHKCEHQFGVNVTEIQADLSRAIGPEQILTMIQSPVDLVIHCSGNSYVGLLTDMTDAEIGEMIQLHLTSPIQLTKGLLSPMIRNKRGRIIVISSIWGLTGAACEVVYSSVKGGLNAFVKALAKELAPSNIQVNGVAPGAIETKMLNKFTQEDLDIMREEIPFGRLGTPQEVANVVSFLASPQSAYISGQIISVNGAWHC